MPPQLVLTVCLPLFPAQSPGVLASGERDQILGSRGQASAAQDPRFSASPNPRVQGPELAGPGQSRLCGAVQHPEAGRVPPGPPQPPPPARPVSATAARRARHVAGAARPPGSRLRRGAGREDRRTHRRTLLGTVRRSAGRPGDGRAGRAGAWARRGSPCAGRAGRAGRGSGTAAGDGPPRRPPLSPRGARDAAADVAPRVAGLHRRRTKTPPQPPSAPGPQPPRQP